MAFNDLLNKKAATLQEQGYEKIYASEDGVIEYWAQPDEPDDMLALSEDVKACEQHAKICTENQNNAFLPHIYDDHLEEDGRLYVARMERLIQINDVPDGPGGAIGHEARNFTNNIAAHLHANRDEEDFAHASALLDTPPPHLMDVVKQMVAVLEDGLDSDAPLVYDRRRQNMMFRKGADGSYDAVFMNCFRSPVAYNGYIHRLFNDSAAAPSHAEHSAQPAPDADNAIDMHESNIRLHLTVQKMVSDGAKIRYISEDAAFYYLTKPDDDDRMICVSSDPVASEVFAAYCQDHHENTWLPTVYDHYHDEDGLLHITEIARYQPLNELNEGIHGNLSFLARNFTNLIAGHDPARDVEDHSHAGFFDIVLKSYPELQEIGKTLSQTLTAHSDDGANSVIYDRTRLNMMFDEKAADGQGHYIFTNCLRTVGKHVHYIAKRPKHPLSVDAACPRGEDGDDFKSTRAVLLNGPEYHI